jgi:hypothetical protein
MRLPDLYYTRSPLDGAPEPPGVPAPINFFNGETLVFDQFLVFEGKPVDPARFEIKAIVKSNSYAHTKVWTGELNNGIYVKQPTGFFTCIVPGAITGAIQPGTYWLEIAITEKAGISTVGEDRTIFLSKTPFCLDYSISSPSQVKLDESSPESTLPPIVDSKQV